MDANEKVRLFFAYRDIPFCKLGRSLFYQSKS